MTSNTSSTLLTERFLSSAARFLSRYRIPFFASILFGFLAHAFAFTNKLINHDELGFLFSKGITISSGRWGLVLVSPLFPECSLPWIYGVISIFLLAVSVCLIVHIFSIRNTLLQILLSGLILSFPALTGTFSYMFTSIYYAVAFLLSIAAVCLVRSYPKNILYVFTALALSVLSTAIYQAYIAITASLFVVLLIQDLLNQDSDVKVLLRAGMEYVLFLAASLGCYWICCKLIWTVTGIPMNDYSQEAVTFQLSTLVTGIQNAYRYFWTYTIQPASGLVSSPLTHYIHIGCFLLIGMELVLWAVQAKDGKKGLFLLFLLTMLPLSINCMYIFIVPYHIHTLVLYSFIAVYVLTVVLIQHFLASELSKQCFIRLRKALFDAAILGLTVVLFSNTYTANAAYLNLYLRYENLHSFCTSVVTQLQATPGYTQDTPVAIIGTYPEPDFYSEEFSEVYNIMGTSGVTPDSWSRENMFAYYIGHELNIVADWEAEVISQTEAFSEMASYPSNGYIQMIDGTIVIKLSDK